ncbi:unnamed protein product [Mycena citricolor]|uniref:Membrane insertase YidC/Oxa/ALB C-terminal domain-containing protein n=1 Tax=Mycena citricolor TaxID=2018698 RepID=A0AAD2K2P9_9AGAR|nr:unnamed protein product [Mycena citricolor]
MKKEGMPKEMLVPATLQRIHMSRMMQRVKAEQKRLIAQHKCHPVLSMAVSPLSQLPVFVVMSIMFNRLAQDPTPFDSEAFFTLTTLNHPDQTWTLPIILGMVTMANVESNNWLMSAYQRERLRKAEEHRQKLAASGQMTIRPQRVVKSVLNVLSVARILLAAISPGSVVLYWTTSATFGLVQTWILDYSPAHRAKTLESVQVQTPVKTTIPEAKAPAAQLKAPVTPGKAPSAAEKSTPNLPMSLPPKRKANDHRPVM